MAEMAVSFAREKLLPLIIDEANLLWGIPKEFAVIKKELEYIQAFLRDADRRAIEEGDNTNAGIKTWVKDLREASFRIEDVIDEYILYVEQHPDAFGCTGLLFECDITHLIESLKRRHQIASEIQQIKAVLDGIKQRSKDYHFQIQPSIQQGYKDYHLMDISFEFVKKCKGLPLAIVAIGGLLSGKEKTTFEWEKIRQSLTSEMEKNHQLIGVTKILGFSYDDLPYNLKYCLLYFGMYPEDYKVNSTRLIRQWIAEGFVENEKGKTLEDIAQEYLRELIGRSLVQVSSFSIDGKAKSCSVHDLLRDLILRKFKDLSLVNI